MKKNSTKLILAGLLLSATVNAQQSQAPAVKNNYVIDAATHINAKSTAIQSRLIAVSFLDFSNGISYSLQDTAFLTYTGDRGHDSALTEIKYDVLIGQEMVSNVLVNDYKSIQQFDNDDRIISNHQLNWDDFFNYWVNDDNVDYTYDADDNILTALTQTWSTGTNTWSNDVKQLYTYDSDNNLTEHITQVWDLVLFTWVNSSRRLYEYNVDNNETQYVYQNWDAGTATWVNSNKTTSIYDVNGDKVVRLYQNWNSGSSTWVNSSQNVYTYDADHNMLTDLYQYDNLGVWQNSSNRIYTYSGNDMETSIQQYWDMGTSSWENDSKQIYSYDSDHRVVMVVYQDYNNGISDFENSSRIHYTYNSFGQVTTYWSETWNTNIWQVSTNDMKQNLYYEEYGTNSVATTSEVADFNLYPVPAQNFVKLEKTFSTPEAFTVSLTDLQGRLIRTYNEKATTNYSRNIDVAQLPAGIYVIKIATPNGKASYKQFSVMH